MGAVARIRLLGQGNSGSLLGGIESSRGSGQANKTFIKIVKPPAQFYPGVPTGIGRDKDELDLTGYSRWQSLQRRTEIRHVHRTLIGTIRIAEK